MPASRTQTRARPHSPPYHYESSSSERSVLNRRTPFPYIEIPNITLLDYCCIIQDEETFDELMATIGHRQSLVNQTRMIRHMWITSQQLLHEVDRQRQEANRIFEQMERMGLQQELYRSRWTRSPQQERSVAPQSSSFHSCKEQSADEEADNELTSLLSGSSPSPGTINNPLVISDDEDDIESSISRPSY
jgi:hypothetical protein